MEQWGKSCFILTCSDSDNLLSEISSKINFSNLITSDGRAVMELWCINNQFKLINLTISGGMTDRLLLLKNSHCRDARLKKGVGSR